MSTAVSAVARRWMRLASYLRAIERPAVAAGRASEGPTGQAHARRVPGGQAKESQAAALCRADWRRPDGYWHCTRPAGHLGRHRLRRGAQAAA